MCPSSTSPPTPSRGSKVFANHTSQVLYLGRGKRIASLAQRLALFGRDRGCTAPGCTAPFSRTQAHHMPDWQYGGPTDIDHLGGACGGHKRGVHAGPATTGAFGWETTILTDGPDEGRIGWRPAGTDLPWQVNPLHHPEKIPGRLPRPTVGRSHGSTLERLLVCKLRVRDPNGVIVGLDRL